MSKRAIILAGGKGRRLLPYTVVLPKPLMPIGDGPILEVVVKQLVKNQFDHITMAVNHQAELIKAFFGDGSKWNIKIDYSLEDRPLSTVGPLKLIDDLPENFLIMNGDILTDLNYTDLFEYHIKNNNLFTISAYQRNELIDYGVLHIDEHGILNRFEEKPREKYLVSMGIYIANKKILNLIPEDTYFGFDHLMHKMIDQGKKVQVKLFEKFWLDIGRPDDYQQAIDIFEKNSMRFID